MYDNVTAVIPYQSPLSSLSVIINIGTRDERERKGRRKKERERKRKRERALKPALNRGRSKASAGRYVLIKPYTYTLDFLPQILRDYPSVKSDQSLSAIRVGNPSRPNWSSPARSIRPHDTFAAIIPNREPLPFTLVFIFGAV